MNGANAIFNQEVLKALNEFRKEYDYISKELISISKTIDNLTKIGNSDEVNNLILAYNRKRTSLWKRNVDLSDAIEKLQVYENVSASELQDENQNNVESEEYETTFDQSSVQYVQDTQYENGYDNQYSYESISPEYEQPNDMSYYAMDDEDSYDTVYQNENSNSQSVQTISDIDESIQISQNVEYKDGFNDDLFDNNDNDIAEFIERNNKQESQKINVPYDQTMLKKNHSVQNTNYEYSQNMQPSQNIDYEDEFNDDLFEEENLITNSFEGKNGIKIENFRITCKNGMYTLNYDKTENNKTIRDLKKTIDINREYLNKKYLKKEFKKRNREDLIKLVENDQIEFNLSYFLQKEFDNKFGTKIDQKYKNKELLVEYDLSDIMSWRTLEISDKLNLYRVALNQEKTGNAKVQHSKTALFILQSIDKFKQKYIDITGDKVQKNMHEATRSSEKLNVNSRMSIQGSRKIKNEREKILVSKSKNNNDSNINNVWNQLDSVRARLNNSQNSKISTLNSESNTDFIRENTRKNLKNNNIFTRARVKIATIAGIAVLIVSGGMELYNKISSTSSNDEKESNFTSASSDKYDNELTQNTTENKNIPENKEDTTKESKFCVNDILTLVYEDNSGNITREYPLSSAKFGEGEKYAASRCNSKLFKISSMIAYNKDTKETIDTIKDKDVSANSLYGKYGSDIGINICLNACDENANITDSREHNLNYDDYTKFSDSVKQKIAESYSKDFAQENKKNITTESIIEEKKSEEENKNQITEESNSQNYYADSNNSAHLFNKDENGNIINACKWTSSSDGSGSTGSAELLDCDSYKFSIVVAREIVDGKSIIRKSVNVEKKDKSVEEIVNELYKTYGDNIKIVYNFNGYKDGKLTDKNLGFISKEKYEAFNAEKTQNSTLSEDDKFNKELESTLSQNEIFKGYKLTLHM